MADTHVDYEGNGSKVDYIITFPFLETSDVKVSVSGVTKTVVNDYTVSGTTLTFTSTAIPPNTAPIRIYRNTNADTAKHTYQAGSSVKADNLNNNQKQVLYKLQEVNEATASGTGLALVAGDKNDITVNGANDWVIRSGAVEASMLASGAVASGIGTGEITSTKIADDAITADKLANSINTEIAANTAKVTNATHTGEVTGATALTIADNIVDEANLKVDNTPTNDQVLTAKSSAAGGLTWASLAAAAPAGWQIGWKHMSTNTAVQVSSNNTWYDTGLELTYTPASSNSLIFLDARQLMFLRSNDHVTNQAQFRFELDDSGSDLGEKFHITGGSSWSGSYGYNVGIIHWPVSFTYIYTNSNTTQKVFKLQAWKDANTYLDLNPDTWFTSSGKSWFILSEIKQ